MPEERKQSLFILLFCLLCLLVTLLSGIFRTGAYQKAVFMQLSEFCEILSENNPGLEDEMLTALREYRDGGVQERTGKGEESTEGAFLSRYGYEPADFAENPMGKMYLPTLFPTEIISSVLPVVLCAAVLFSARRLARRRRERILGLTEYLERVNTGAPGTLIRKEDEFSHLRDEIYKTVTKLYATRDAALRAKESFADNLDNIAHQLKTPLTASFLSLQLMEAKAPNIYAEQIKKQLQRLNRLEEALLRLSGMDSGTLHLEKAPVDVYTALTLAAENLDGLLAEKQVCVEIPDRGTVTFPGDLEWTMEALMNLIKNGMEHSPAGGHIFCDYSENPLYVQILIQDEGEGFAKEDMPHLFERFYRGKNAAEGSTGIGLALSRAIVERQNGTLTARNLSGEGERGGACFEIRIYRCQ